MNNRIYQYSPKGEQNPDPTNTKDLNNTKSNTKEPLHTNSRPRTYLRTKEVCRRVKCKQWKFYCHEKY